TITMLHEPSANLSLPGLNIVYTPAGLGYAISPFLQQYLRYLHALIFAFFLSVASIIVFSSTILWLHHRLLAIETATTQHQQHTTHTAKQLAHILRTMLAALKNVENDIEEHVTYLTCFIETAIETAGADVDKLAAILDADLEHVTSRCDLQGKMILSVERNVEQARYILAGMADGEDGSEDDLQIGDEVEKFWFKVASDESEGVEGEVEEVEIDVEATKKAVWKWLRKRCAWPEECEDIFEEG
ncbi:hypothetical protein FB567DRAFT_453591, partial [Paraphoma chrysanthemicola]